MVQEVRESAREQIAAALQEFSVADRIPVDADTVVAYSGVPGAFAEQAAVDFFGEDCPRLPVHSFRQVMEALEKREAQYGVLPIENSSAGNVESNYDLLSEYHMTIVGEQTIAVNQALMALPGTKLEQIRTVYSHPQGLMQCSRFLEQMGWQQVSMSNTAKSALRVHEEQDATQAAIASERAARLYGLEVLNPAANNIKNNATRFIILSRDRIYTRDANKVGITFGVPHQSGSLYGVLGSIVRYQLNMTMIESRPIPGKRWEYYFYIEFIGNLEDPQVAGALSEIAHSSTNLRILGNYHTRDLVDADCNRQENGTD